MLARFGVISGTFWTGIGSGLMLLATVSAFAEVLLRDDFSAAAGRYEFIGGRAWKIGGGECRFAAPGRDAFAVANLEELSEAHIEATVTVSKRLNPGYVTAGLTLFLDSNNHWRLLLVASPEDRPYFELVERHMGVHQAQSAPPSSGTQLAGKSDGELTSWEYGRPYRLILSWSPKEIVGEARTPDSRLFWRRTYSFATCRAVRSGRPGLTASGTEGVFTDFHVEGVRPPMMPGLAVERGPAGSALIVEDEAAEVARPCQEILKKAGFGVKVVEWEDLGRGRLPAESLDLLVLADARRLPSHAARAVVSFLRSSGKILTIGAPAFGELLIKTPRGYVTEAQYAESVYNTLTKHFIAFKAEAWVRSSRDPRRKAAIVQESSSAQSAAAPQIWKVTTDLHGWDNFGQTVEGAFADGRSLLCFRARGDDNTPQLSIECREKDGARWIATIELSKEWRVYVLRPHHFDFWHDSPVKRRLGDRLNPANVNTIFFGLSSSHTPKCQPGLHTFWFDSVATAPDPNAEEYDVHIPEIEALCPSYKIYPLWETTALRIGGRQFQIPDFKSQIEFKGKAYSPVWRDGGIGFDRQRAWRWVRVLDAYDGQGRNRGALAWLMLGNQTFSGAVWSNIGLAAPEELLSTEPLKAVLRAMAASLARGCFLLEAGTRYFSYYSREKIDFGALVMNSGRKEQTLTVAISVVNSRGKAVFEKLAPITVPAGRRSEVRWDWTPPGDNASEFPYTFTAQLLEATTDGNKVLDIITHDIDLLPEKPASPDEFVKVEGSNFILGGKPWFMRGINYRPTSMAGNPLVGQQMRRESYDPAVIERDLAWMESAGINMLSAIQALVPDDPDAPGAYRDELDFLNRCRKHGMKVFYFLYWGNPMAGGDVGRIKEHILKAGIKDHPAILAWELAWEPIYYSGPVKKGNMQFLLSDWNAWVLERYGSVENAEKDWGFRLERVAQPPSAVPATGTSLGGSATQNMVAMPDQKMCSEHGPWDRAVAAFRRFFSDRVGRGYGEVIRELRRWDPKHLITFRFGACGIPDKARFAHAHSAAVAKHVDFLCPEGYNLQTGGWAKPTPPDDLRKGGLVTLYYRFLSREKPVVWMEFGYTVNGFHTVWKTGREHIKPEDLALQRMEYENFYKMFIESGARGAAPWWLPGGFRLGENSDFGILEPDGAERPACEVLKAYLPLFAQVKQRSCVLPRNVLPESGRLIELDFDAHYADAWDFYSRQYLEAVKAGELPFLRTEGTGSTSADCPLVAVGNTPCNGKNPPKFLNAEFNWIEVKVSPQGNWRPLKRGDVVSVKKGAQVLCRASVGNTEEATWLAAVSKADSLPAPGVVYLSCTCQPSNQGVFEPIAADTPYLHDAHINEFELLESIQTDQTATFTMVTPRRVGESGSILILPFGEKWSVTLKVVE